MEKRLKKIEVLKGPEEATARETHNTLHTVRASTTHIHAVRRTTVARENQTRILQYIGCCYVAQRPHAPACLHSSVAGASPTGGAHTQSSGGGKPRRALLSMSIAACQSMSPSPIGLGGGLSGGKKSHAGSSGAQRHGKRKQPRRKTKPAIKAAVVRTCVQWMAGPVCGGQAWTPAKQYS